jgi:uncharacterized protein (DUF1015 family)
MALVIPFKGIVYNKERINDFSFVVAPPYDVISEEDKKKLCNRHPQNVVRLVLGEPGERFGDNSNFYSLSAKRFQAWMADGTLVTDDVPAIYLTSVEFTADDKRFQRYGFIAYVRLEPFANRVVLPHERTSSKVKTDRLNLSKATGANFCQIFSLYSDPEQVIVNTLLDSVAGRQPDIDLVDDAGERHRLWRITDSRIAGQVTAAFKEKRLYIADGHHRYETALNYRAWIAENNPDFSETHAANYVMMSLSSISDPGLVILPSHRLLLKVNQTRLSELLGQAADYFDVTEIPFDPADRKKAEQQFKNHLQTHFMDNAIGAVVNGRPVFYVLTLRPGAMEKAFGDTIPEVLRTLDVTVLTQLILKKILGYSQSELDEEEAIAYTSNFGRAVEIALAGKCRAAFLLNPTRSEQVQAAAAQGEIMPRKSTYYYPKVLTGFVFSDQTKEGILARL